MKKIVILCSQGASTSILVKAMEKAAAQMEYACDIHAYSINELNQVKDSADIILLGPQIRFQEAKVKQEASCKVMTIYMAMYGMMDGKGVLEVVKKEIG